MPNPLRYTPKIWVDPATGERFLVVMATRITEKPLVSVLVTNDGSYKNVPMTIDQYNGLPRITMMEVSGD